MCTHDNYVSPNLRRRLRTLEEIAREEAERSEQVETAPRMPGHEASDDVAPTR